MTSQVAIRRTLRRKLESIASRIDIEQNTLKLAQRLLNRTKSRYLRQVDPDGKPWAALAPYTIKYKAKHYPRYATTVLRRTDALYESLKILRGVQDKTSRSGIATGLGVRIGFDAVDPRTRKLYGRYHQRGTKNMPQRKILGINKDDVRSLQRLMDSLIHGRAIRL